MTLSVPEPERSTAVVPAADADRGWFPVVLAEAPTPDQIREMQLPEPVVGALGGITLWASEFSVEQVNGVNKKWASVPARIIAYQLHIYLSHYQAGSNGNNEMDDEPKLKLEALRWLQGWIGGQEEGNPMLKPVGPVVDILVGQEPLVEQKERPQAPIIEEVPGGWLHRLRARMTRQQS